MCVSCGSGPRDLRSCGRGNRRLYTSLGEKPGPTPDLSPRVEALAGEVHVSGGAGQARALFQCRHDCGSGVDRAARRPITSLRRVEHIDTAVDLMGEGPGPFL